MPSRWFSTEFESVGMAMAAIVAMIAIVASMSTIEKPPLPYQNRVLRLSMAAN